MPEPAAPDAETRERLLAVLAELVGRGGAERLALAPIAPGVDAFPDPWAKSAGAARLLLRRLAWHAGFEREIVLDDQRAGQPVTERKPTTRVELVELRPGVAAFTLGFIGDDDVVGTFAHEIGVAFAALHRPDRTDPYRTAEPPVIAVDPDLDLERGSIATVYLGLGVLAANAAFQQYQRGGRFNGGYEPLEYDVLRAGYLPMSSLAFLLAIQAIVRGDDVAPVGLAPPQRDEVSAWITALRGKRQALRERLGIAEDVSPRSRSKPTAFTEGAPSDEPAAVAPTAFRWRTHRGGVGLVAGTVLGIGFAIAASRGMMPWLALGGATGGHVLGRRVRVPRCSACATIVGNDATSCRKCGASLRGEIEHLSQRLEAEEQLEAESTAHPPVESDGSAGRAV